MPIDPMILNSLLGTYKNMIEDCKQKEISGEDFDQMCQLYERMEALGQEHDDMNAFNGQVMQENLYGRFSDHYGRALSAQAQQNTSTDAGSYDDAALLKQSIDALKQAIESINQSYQDAIEEAKGKKVKQQTQAGLDYAKRNPEQLGIAGDIDQIREGADQEIDKTMEKTPNAFDNSVEVEIMQNPEEIIKPIQEVINLGEQPDMTLPKFLRLQIEKGLDKAMEGGIVARKGLETTLKFESVNPVSPFHIEKAEEQLNLFDELADKHSFTVPNWKELNLGLDDISRKFEPQIIKWKTLKEWGETLFWELSFWATAHLDYAPYLEPWNLSENPKKAVKRTKDTLPGIFKERERLYTKYFNLSFHDIFKHPTFEWEVKHQYFGYSQEYTEFIIEYVYPECKPFNFLSKELVDKKEYYYQKNKEDIDREANPEGHFPTERMRVFYNSKFGEGRFESKYGPVVKNNSQSAPWNYETFKFSK